jgi:hypothetical protein
MRFRVDLYQDQVQEGWGSNHLLTPGISSNLFWVAEFVFPTLTYLTHLFAIEPTINIEPTWISTHRYMSCANRR